MPLRAGGTAGFCLGFATLRVAKPPKKSIEVTRFFRPPATAAGGSTVPCAFFASVRDAELEAARHVRPGKLVGFA
jgi:hypothetical protein